MELNTATLLCNTVGRILSLPNLFEPLSCEPLGKRKLKQQKEFMRSDVISGEQLLKEYTDLSHAELAILIETQIDNEYRQREPIFATPYILLHRTVQQSSRRLAVVVTHPYTSTPHVSYRAGIKCLDFSKVFFEHSELKKYLKKHLQPSGKKSKDAKDRTCALAFSESSDSQCREQSATPKDMSKANEGRAQAYDSRHREQLNIILFLIKYCREEFERNDRKPVTKEAYKKALTELGFPKFMEETERKFRKAIMPYGVLHPGD